MKTKLALLALLLNATIAHANLIDLTPCGFNINDPWPTPVVKFFGWYGLGMQNLAGANINGNMVSWSPFTLFGPNEFNISPVQPEAGVNWNLTGTGTGYFLQYVLVESSGSISHLYGIRGTELFNGEGFVAIDGALPITAITFAGSNQVPDTDATLVLFAISGLGLFLIRPLRARG